MKLFGTFAVFAAVAAQDEYESYEYYPQASDYPLDNYQAGDFGTETDAAEATYDSYGNYDTYQGDYDANYTAGPGSDGQKAHHEFLGAMAASANNNNNNNNSANKRPTNQNKRPQNSANKRPNNQNKRPQQQQQSQQQHVQHHNNNNHHDQQKQQTQQAAPATNNQQWQSQTAAGNWQTGQQASNGYNNYQANGQQYPAAGTYQAPAYGLSCWKCNADSFDLCEKRGYEEKCQPNQEVCELEIRERMGYIYQIHMGCKSADACANNKKANFDNPNPHYTQCRPEKNMGYHHSVCRQCCHDSMCTKSPSWWYPASREEWAYE